MNDEGTMQIIKVLNTFMDTIRKEMNAGFSELKEMILEDRKELAEFKALYERNREEDKKEVADLKKELADFKALYEKNRAEDKKELADFKALYEKNRAEDRKEVADLNKKFEDFKVLYEKNRKEDKDEIVNRVLDGIWQWHQNIESTLDIHSKQIRELQEVVGIAN
jgi:hypothetical protein